MSSKPALPGALGGTTEPSVHELQQHSTSSELAEHRFLGGSKEPGAENRLDDAAIEKEDEPEETAAGHGTPGKLTTPSAKTRPAGDAIGVEDEPAAEPEETPAANPESHPPGAPAEGEATEEYPTTYGLLAILSGTSLIFFAVLLDQSILSTVSCLSWTRDARVVGCPAKRTASHYKPHDANRAQQAVPQITSDFHSLPDVGWYSGAYQLVRYVHDPASLPSSPIHPKY